jgi:hypothetical protein
VKGRLFLRTVGVVLCVLVAVALSPLSAIADSLLTVSSCADSTHNGVHDCTKAMDTGVDPSPTTDPTYFQTTGTAAGEWISIDLGSAGVVNHFYLSQGCFNPSTTGSGAGCNPHFFKIQYSDTGSSWTTIDGCNADAACAAAQGNSYCATAYDSCVAGPGGCASNVECSIYGSPGPHRFWRAEAESTTVYGWVINAFQLYGVAGGPSAHLVVSPSLATVVVGHATQFRLQSVDDFGIDVTAAQTYTVLEQPEIAPGTAVPFFGSSCGFCAVSGSTVTVSATTVGFPLGWFRLRFADTAGNLGYADWQVVGATASFVLYRSPADPIAIGQAVTVWNFAQASDGSVISGADGFTITPQANQTCSVPGIRAVNGVPQDWRSTCSWSAAGTYVVNGTDLFGAHASVTVNVSTVTAPGSSGCASDIGGVACWVGYVASQLYNVIRQLALLPAEIAGAVVNFLFVSQNGKSYLDLSNLNFIPTITCRPGEVPTALDGVHCLPFPFALPAELAAFWTVLTVSPVTPAIDWHIVYTLPAPFTSIDAHVPIIPTVILNTTVMGWVRGAEYVLFVLSLFLATRKYVQMFGVD